MDPSDPVVMDRLTDDAGDDSFPIWSPDGRRIAFWRNPGDAIWVVDALGITEPVQVSPTGSGPPFFWSPDGTRIYYSSGGLKWSSTDGSLIQSPVDGGGGVCQPDLSPVTMRIVYFECGGGDKELKTAALTLSDPGAISDVRDLFPNPDDSDLCGTAATREVTLPAWSPDGSRVAFGRDTAHFVNNPNVVSSDGLGCFEVFDPLPNQYAANPRWSPDSEWLTYDGRQGQHATTDIYVVAADDDSSVHNLTADEHYDRDPDWAMDPGTAIVWASDRDGGPDLDLWRMNPRDPATKVPITDYAGDEAYPLWSPDATQIAFARGPDSSNAIWIVDANGTDPPVQLTPVGSGTSLPSFWSLDGTRVYYVRASGGLKWVSTSGDLIEHTVTGGSNVCQPDFSPSGSTIVFFECGGGDRELKIGSLSMGDPGTLTLVGDLFPNPDDSDVCGTASTREVTLPAWSPDGTRIAFGRDTAHFVNTPNVVSADGTGCFEVLDPPLSQYAFNPRWSPDAQSLTFESRTGPGGTTDIYTQKVGETSSLSNLTNDTFADLHPDWAVDVDDTPPVVSGTPDRPANGNGWFNADVLIDWTAIDPQPSSGLPSHPPDTVAATEAASVVYTSALSCDPAGNCATGSLTLSIDKTPPLVTSIALDANPKAVSATATLSAGVSDELSGVSGGEFFIGTDPGQGNGAAMTLAGSALTGIIDDSVPVGVYSVSVRSQDAADNWSEAATSILVVYDPTAGFATGGGWITPKGPSSDPSDVLPGICETDGACSEKANFGFIVRYKNGAATVPGGNLEFHYNVSGFHVKSTDMEWLVVTNSNWAHFQGTATIGGLSGVHAFRVDARDSNGGGQPDRFVIRIWAPGDDSDVDEPLYKASGDVEGGQVKIHS